MQSDAARAAESARLFSFLRAAVDAFPVHSAPVHSAPVHSAPVHSAPVHSAPVHSAPVHSAPVHSAPVHSAPAAPRSEVHALYTQVVAALAQAAVLPAVPSSLAPTYTFPAPSTPPPSSTETPLQAPLLAVLREVGDAAHDVSHATHPCYAYVRDGWLVSALDALQRAPDALPAVRVLRMMHVSDDDAAPWVWAVRLTRVALPVHVVCTGDVPARLPWSRPGVRGLLATPRAAAAAHVCCVTRAEHVAHALQACRTGGTLIVHGFAHDTRMRERVFLASTCFESATLLPAPFVSPVGAASNVAFVWIGVRKRTAAYAQQVACSSDAPWGTQWYAWNAHMTHTLCAVPWAGPWPHVAHALRSMRDWFEARPRCAPVRAPSSGEELQRWLRCSRAFFATRDVPLVCTVDARPVAWVCATQTCGERAQCREFSLLGVECAGTTLRATLPVGDTLLLLRTETRTYVVADLSAASESRAPLQAIAAELSLPLLPRTLRHTFAVPVLA
jgi:hypothetical protein